MARMVNNGFRSASVTSVTGRSDSVEKTTGRTSPHPRSIVLANLRARTVVGVMTRSTTGHWWRCRTLAAYADQVYYLRRSQPSCDSVIKAMTFTGSVPSCS